MSDIATKLTYLNETKSQLKDMINYGLPTENQITNETTFRNYVKGIFEAFLESLRDSTTLYTNLPKISGNGTQITLNDTANAPMRITLKASELSQDATPTPDSPQDIHTISGDNSVVVEGKNLFNGSLYNGVVENADGTFKSTTQYESSTAVTFKGSINETYRLQTFHKDGTKPSGSNSIPFYAAINGSWKNLSTIADGVTFTTDANGEATIKIGASSWGDIGKEDIYILLTKTNVVNTFNDYEPYVSQTNPINLSSINLFDKDSTDIILNYRLDGTGDEYLENGYYISPFIKVKPHTAYTKNSPNANAYHRFAFYTNNDKTSAISVSPENTIITPSNCQYLRFCGLQTEINSARLEEGLYNTLPIEYCKIGNYEDEFILTSGKNLLQNNLTSQTISGVTFTKNEDGTITANGTATASIYLNLNTEITLDKGNYKLSGCPSGGSNSTYTLYENSKGYNSFDYGSGLDITLTESKTFRVSLAIYSGATVNNLVFKPMLNKGTTVLPYEPYGTNQWYLKKNIGKYVYNNDLVNNGSFTERFNFLTPTLNVKPDLTNNELGAISLCNMMATITSGGTGLRGTTSSSKIRIDISTSIVSSYDEAKTLFANNNLTIYYVLLTPTYTQITGTLETQLNNIYKNMLSYKGTTNVSQISNDLPFIINVSAIQDLE